MAEQQQRRGHLALELNCDDYKVSGASFTPDPAGGEGGLFSCSIGPITDATAAALDRAREAHALVNLVFSDHPLLLDLVMLQRKAPQLIRIVGRVVMSSTKGQA